MLQVLLGEKPQGIEIHFVLGKDWCVALEPKLLKANQPGTACSPPYLLLPECYFFDNVAVRPRKANRSAVAVNLPDYLRDCAVRQKLERLPGPDKAAEAVRDCIW